MTRNVMGRTGEQRWPNGQGRNRHVCPNGPCPLLPRQRQYNGHRGTSHLCHFRKKRYDKETVRQLLLSGPLIYYGQPCRGEGISATRGRDCITRWKTDSRKESENKKGDRAGARSGIRCPDCVVGS